MMVIEIFTQDLILCVNKLSVQLFTFKNIGNQPIYFSETHFKCSFIFKVTLLGI